MLTYPNIDPIAISLGSVNVHWYGLMYLIGFLGVWILGRYRAKNSQSPITPESIEDLVFYGAMGVVLGGRIGYVLFYNFSSFLQDPILIFKIWQGGMSFHGGLLGVLFAMWLFGKKHRCTMFQLIDFLAPLAPIGLFTGRIGNFINGELWGRVTTIPWGMVFPEAGPLPRHPSQLYEAFFEGFLLFIILWFFTQKPKPYRAPTGLVFICYGCFRFFVEFFRTPDAHIGFIALNWLTMGQLLSIPMIVIGFLLLFLAYRKT